MKVLEKARKEACSIRTPEDKRGLTYIGSLEGYEDHGRIYDYYQSPDGSWFYETRQRLPDGTIVSSETAIFGREVSKRLNRRKSCYARS